jgi:hypothetical protein
MVIWLQAGVCRAGILILFIVFLLGDKEMADRSSRFGGLVTSAFDSLRTLSGFGGLSKQDDSQAGENDPPDSGGEGWGGHHHPRADDLGYVEPYGSEEGLHTQSTLGNRLFLGPEDKGQYVGNSWNYSDHISPHLPWMSLEVLQRKLIPDFQRGARPLTYKQRANELIRDELSLLPDPEVMMQIRAKHWENPADSYLSRMLRAFYNTQLLGKDGVTLVFAGAPIVAMGSSQKRFITLDWTPDRLAPEATLSHGWTTGHVGVEEPMRGYAYFLLLPPFQERRRATADRRRD